MRVDEGPLPGLGDPGSADLDPVISRIDVHVACRADNPIAVVHDENMNGKLDTNRLGIPTEGYGFSNGARAVLGPPSFSAASFRHDGGTLNLSIRLRY